MVFISDEQKKTCTDYGVWVEKSMYGKKYMGVARSTFIINKEGLLVTNAHVVSAGAHKEDPLSTNHVPFVKIRFANGREVPGTHEICCTLISHFGDLNGPIALVDIDKGRFNPKAITSITPEVPWPGNWPDPNRLKNRVWNGIIRSWRIYTQA